MDRRRLTMSVTEQEVEAATARALYYAPEPRPKTVQAVLDYITPHPRVQTWLEMVMADDRLPSGALLAAIGLARLMDADGVIPEDAAEEFAGHVEYAVSFELNLMKQDPEWRRLLDDFYAGAQARQSLLQDNQA